MDFYAVLDQVLDLLRQRGRVTYRALKRQFDLDDAFLEDLKAEIIEAQHLAVDEAGTVLVWTGTAAAGSPPAAVPALSPERAPLAYTPVHLAEKIRTAKSALAGERKQVTVFFADIKDSTQLIEGLDPEAAQQLLDPAIHCMMDAVHRFEGTVNQVLGDGIMALFGAPIAHEDHALRACYAALALQSTVRPYAEEVRRRPWHGPATAGRAQFRRGGSTGHWQRPAHGLLGGRADDAPGGAPGAARHAREHPVDRRHAAAGGGPGAGQRPGPGASQGVERARRGL